MFDKETYEQTLTETFDQIANAGEYAITREDVGQVLNIEESTTVGALRSFLEALPDSAKISISNDMEGLIQIDPSEDRMIIDVW